ncbi:MAG: PAS domain S-box protein [Hyphomonadaceae bacterium]|nr:PAS domain S-box protein [Clostridia bacterium]
MSKNINIDTDKLISKCTQKIFSVIKFSAKRTALKITLIYFMIGCLWVLLSDMLVETFVKDPSTTVIINIAKGWFYVFVTAILIYLLVFSALKKLVNAKEALQQLNRVLEEKVAHRTQQLESTNAILIKSNALLEQEVIERQKVQKQIAILNESLEVKVLERTIQLQLINKQLEEEILEKVKAEKDLSKERYFNDAVLNSVPGLLYLYNMDGKLIRWNKKHEEMTGYSSNELSEMHLADFFIDDEFQTVVQKVEKTIQDGVGEAELILRRKDGTYIPIFCTAVRLELDGSLYFVGMGVDISERKKTEDRLQKYKILAENTNDAMLFIDKQGKILEVNQAASKLYGYTYEEFLKMEIYDLRRTYEKHLINEKMALADQEGCIFEAVHKMKNGALMHVEISAQGTYLGQTRVLLSIIRDITDRKSAEQNITYLSYHDKLTGLYNRRFYEDEIKRLDIEENLPISIMIGDINGLKLINDIFGHIEGDSLIVMAAENINKVCRSNDVIARWGGDEIIMLLPKTSACEVEVLCKKIDTTLQKDHTLRASLSIGYATKKNINEDINQVLKVAEDFMYKRKLLQTRSLRSSIVSSIISTLQERSIETQEHSDRMKELSKATGNAMRVSETMLDDLELLAILHDIGKIAIKDSIINKNAKLTEEEWAEMKRHPEIGYHITQSTAEFQHLSEYVLSHHENWDGGGYPRELKGEEIPLLSRIISVVDAFDAMTNDRPYRKAMSKKSAIQELKANAGTQFDPKVVRVFINDVVRCL